MVEGEVDRVDVGGRPPASACRGSAVTAAAGRGRRDPFEALAQRVDLGGDLGPRHPRRDDADDEGLPRAPVERDHPRRRDEAGVRLPRLEPVRAAEAPLQPVAEVTDVAAAEVERQIALDPALAQPIAQEVEDRSVGDRVVDPSSPTTRTRSSPGRCVSSSDPGPVEVPMKVRPAPAASSSQKAFASSAKSSSNAASGSWTLGTLRTTRSQLDPERGGPWARRARSAADRSARTGASRRGRRRGAAVRRGGPTRPSRRGDEVPHQRRAT